MKTKNSKPKILIVDDKVENLVALERTLDDVNVDFLRATSGNEALALTLEHDFAIALVDVQMPEMDGFETVELMREDKKNKQLPVIFVSAIYKEEYYLVKGIETGAVDFITKPIVPEILRGKVKIFLDLYEYRISLEREIESRIKSEDRLRESEEKFRTIFENANDEILYLDKKGMVIDVNDKVEDIFGWKREEVLGKNFSDFMSVETDAMERVIDLFSDAINNEATSHVTVEARHRDGRTVFVEGSSRFVQRDGEAEGILVILRDISGRKRAEQHIMQRNRELTALNDIAQSISQSFDLDDILNNALDKTLQILEINNGSIHLMDKGMECLVPKIHRGMSDAATQSVSRMELWEGIAGMATKTGEPIWVESLPDIEGMTQDSASMVLEQQLKSAMFLPLKTRGEIQGVLSATTQGDRIFTPEERELLITVSHQISTAIENAQLMEEASRAEALEELDHLRTELLASVSHELRTPLTSIKGLASTLTQEDVEWDRDTQNDFLRIIDKESDILTHIVEDLMQMSQMEAGIMTMHKSPSSISVVVSQLSDHLRGLVSKHEFRIDIPQGMPQIYADQIRIGQVITNLVSNAAAYSEEGTRITLEAGRYNGNVVVSVSDQGIGIASQHIDKVFDRFYRLESGIARRRGGTGLGLAICKGIVEGHDGLIWVESRLGQGSKFSFSIPVLQNASTHPENKRSIPAHFRDGGTKQ